MLKESLTVGIILLFISLGITPIVNSDNPISTKTIYVDDDNTAGPWDGTQEHPYRYIQDGVDNASDGDTVFVYSGVYHECIVVNKSITLQGGDKNITIIDLGSHHPDVAQVLVIDLNWAIIKGFKIQNGKYGIHVKNSSDITITGNTMYNNIMGIRLYG